MPLIQVSLLYLELMEGFTNDRTGALLADGQRECRKEARCVALNSCLEITVICADISMFVYIHTFGSLRCV